MYKFPQLWQPCSWKYDAQADHSKTIFLWNVSYVVMLGARVCFCWCRLVATTEFKMRMSKFITKTRHAWMPGHYISSEFCEKRLSLSPSSLSLCCLSSPHLLLLSVCIFLSYCTYAHAGAKTRMHALGWCTFTHNQPHTYTRSCLRTVKQWFLWLRIWLRCYHPRLSFLLGITVADLNPALATHSFQIIHEHMSRLTPKPTKWWLGQFRKSASEISGCNFRWMR